VVETGSFLWGTAPFFLGLGGSIRRRRDPRHGKDLPNFASARPVSGRFDRLATRKTRVVVAPSGDILPNSTIAAELRTFREILS